AMASSVAAIASDQAKLASAQRRLGPVARADFLQQAGHVIFDRALAETELLTNLAIAQAVCQQPQYFCFALSQRLSQAGLEGPGWRRQAGELRHHSLSHRRLDEGSAPLHRADSVRQLLAGQVFEQIPERSSAQPFEHA